MARTWTHFAYTGPERVRLSPGGFHLLPAGPPNTVHIAEAKHLAVVAMSINVPTRDPNVDQCGWVKLEIVRKVFHAAPKIFGPLAANIVRNDDARELHTCERRKDYVVHVAVPDVCTQLSSVAKERKLDIPFAFL